MKYGTDDDKVTVALLDTQGQTVASTEVTADGKMKTVTIENSTENDYKVKIAPKKRCYVEYVGIYDGEFSDEDFNDTENAPKLLLGMKTPETKNGITENSYTFTGLEAANYQWRVQAVKGNVVSPWTSWIDVTVGTPSCIKDIEIANDSRIDVYSLSGIFVGNMTYEEFVKAPIANGTYILRNAKTSVVMTK